MLVRIMYIMLTYANTTEDAAGQPESPRAVPDPRKDVGGFPLPIRFGIQRSLVPRC